MSCLSCFGGIFGRRKKGPEISPPMGTIPQRAEASRLSKLPISIEPTSVDTPGHFRKPSNASIGLPTSPEFRSIYPPSPGLPGTNIRSPGMSPRMVGRPFGSESPSFPPPIYDSTNPSAFQNYRSVPAPSGTNTPITPYYPMNRTPPTPGYSYDEKTSGETLRSTKATSPSSQSFNFDTTPRAHKFFQKLMPFSSKPADNTITFVDARKAEEPVLRSQRSFSKLSQRFSRRWNSHNIDTAVSAAPSSTEPTTQVAPKRRAPPPQPLSSMPPVPAIPAGYQHPVMSMTPTSPPPPSLPPSARNGLGQCLTTRLPNGDSKPVTMVPRLQVNVSNLHPNRNLEPTPIEASPVAQNKDWRFTRGDEGYTDSSQAWML